MGGNIGEIETKKVVEVKKIQFPPSSFSQLLICSKTLLLQTLEIGFQFQSTELCNIDRK